MVSVLRALGGSYVAYQQDIILLVNDVGALTLNLDISSNSTSRASQERAKKRSEMEAKRVLYKGSFSLKTSSK